MYLSSYPSCPINSIPRLDKFYLRLFMSLVCIYNIPARHVLMPGKHLAVMFFLNCAALHIV